MSDDYGSWVAQARRACAASGLPAPQAHELEDMYEDGLEPSDAADPNVRARYQRRTRPVPERSVADLAIEAARRAGARPED